MNGSPLFGFCAKRGKLLEVMIRPSRWPAASVYARSLMSSTVRPYRVPDTTGEANRRSDLYTLGVVLYEMLAGQRCVPAGSHSEIMRAVISDAPIPLTTLNPAIPIRGYTREAAIRPNRRLSRRPFISFLTGCSKFPDRIDCPAGRGWLVPV